MEQPGDRVRMERTSVNQTNNRGVSRPSSSRSEGQAPVVQEVESVGRPSSEAAGGRGVSPVASPEMTAVAAGEVV